MIILFCVRYDAGRIRSN